MDGHFVPNISFGPLVIEAVKKSVSIPLDVHLMISEPHKYIDQFCNAGADILTIHAETCSNLSENNYQNKKTWCKGRRERSNSGKSIEAFYRSYSTLDQVLIMTVYAGFGGQKFINEMLHKIKGSQWKFQSRII
jgi:ribulose-phosphate 3-epimerase